MVSLRFIIVSVFYNEFIFVLVKPFFLKDWNFDTKNFKELIDLVKASKDGKEFNCDISMLDWELYFKNYLLGIENYILKGRKRNGKL